MVKAWSCLILVLVAACAGRRPAPPLAGPSSAPVYETAERIALIAAPVEGDWNGLTDEAASLLSQYIRINTTNPPGDEILAARWLATVLQHEGIETRIFEPAPGKANLYARLSGDGSARPLILLNHMDVVLASREYWTVDPFSGVIKDGYVWGRGALDMKGEGVAHLMAMIALKRAGVPLNRDIVFIGNSDEELGSTGAIVFVKNHPDLLKDVEYLVTEGGDNLVTDGKLHYFGIGVSEKRTFWQKLSVK